MVAFLVLIALFALAVCVVFANSEHKNWPTAIAETFIGLVILFAIGAVLHN
jgi:hypothetical protein